MNVKMFKGDSKEWNEKILNKNDYNVFEIYEWGEVKKKSGWSVLRLVLFSKNSQNHIQIFYKKKFNFFSFVWIPYGFNKVEELFNSEILIENLKKFIKTKLIYVRSNFHFTNQHLSIDKSFLKNWKKSSYQIMSGQTSFINLTKTNEEWIKSIKSKHRYYLKKSLKEKTIWLVGNDKFHLNHFLRLFKEMHKIKNIKKNLLPLQQISSVNKQMPLNHFIILGKINEKIIVGAFIVFFGNKSHYYLASANDYGRKKMISYSMINEIRKILISKNVHYFDFGGINTFDKKFSGINHFKLGFSDRNINIMGEYENSNIFFLNPIINLLLKLRYEK